MIRTDFLILIFVLSNNLLGVHTTHASSPCAEFLNSVREGASSSEADETKDFMAYLGMLLVHQVIGKTELLRLIEGLERGELLNPIVEEKAETGIASQIQRGGIQGYLDRGRINHEKLLEFAKKTLKEKERVRVKRGEVREETHDTDQKMEFNLVPAGSFEMGEEGEKKRVHLTNSIEVMSTQVTQRHWAELMGENPSEFASGEESITVNINGKLVMMQPNHPVENITWWSVLVFLNRLSERDGLKPAYDLSKMKWIKRTRAENGTLSAESGKIKINAGNYYRLEGYRLPTEAEQEYLLRAAGKANGRYYFGEDEAELRDHAWYKENSDGKTHVVGELKSLDIEGFKFYDVLGNVWEWRWDRPENKLKGGRNPVGSKNAFSRVVLGGSWGSNARGMRWRESYLTRSVVVRSPMIYRNGGVGFRAVRTPRPPFDVFTFSRLKSFLGKMGLRKSNDQN